jgi:hypothetical protein
VVRLNRLNAGSYVVEVTVSGSEGSSQSHRRVIRLLDN